MNDVFVDHINKSFPGVKALNNVNLKVSSGRIHALLGANGSGKSTMVKVLTGVYQPDVGSIVVSGERVSSISSPAEARRLGIRVVHQEAPLIDNLTVAECVGLFRKFPLSPSGRIRWREHVTSVGQLFERLDIPVNPKTLTAKLTPSERAMVSLAIALDNVDESSTSLLILDEADASIPEDDAEPFLERVRKIADSGIPVLFVTHRLKDAAKIADDVTIFSNGQVIYAGTMDSIDEESIINKMISDVTGEREDESLPENIVSRLWSTLPSHSKRGVKDSLLSLEIQHLSGRKLRDLSLSIRRGEILGIAGLSDSGIGELPLILAGAEQRTGGTVRINGRELPAKLSPRQSIRSGIVLIPADRLRQGGVGSLPVDENITLPDARRYWHRSNRRKAVVERIFEAFDVRPRDEKKPFGSLSGGNQQKAILAKWLMLKPSLIVLDDPTSGVDPGARKKIYAALKDAANQGASVIYSSTEPEQLASICNRVVILREGEIVVELTGDDLTREKIARWCYA